MHRRRSSLLMAITATAAIAVLIGVLVAPRMVNWLMDRALIGTAYTAPTGPPALADSTWPTDGSTLQTLILGDSLTHGLYATREDERYASLLADRISKIGSVRAEIQGTTSITASQTLRSDLPVGPFDLLVVELGTNDVYRSTPDVFAADYPALLDALVSSSPTARIVCVGTWAPPRAAYEFDKIISESCRARGGTFVGISDIVTDRASRSKAGTQWYEGVTTGESHPNTRGHERLASFAFTAIAGTHQRD